MALSIIHGKPGQGKSLVAVTLYILPALLAGQHVATNIEMVPDAIGALFKKRFGKIFNPERLQILERDEVPAFFEHVPAGKKGEPVLVVIDEAHKYFNARDFAKNDSKYRDTFVKLTEHRHYHLELIMLSQSVKNIDAQIVRLHNGITTLKNLREWHFPRIPWLKIPYYDFLAIRRDGDGKTIMRRDWIKFDKELAACYNTHSVSQADQLANGATGKVNLNVDPETAARIAKIKQMVKLASLLMLLAVAAFLGAKFTGGGKEKKAVPSPVSRSAGVSVSSALGISDHSSRPAVQVPAPRHSFLDEPPFFETFFIRVAVMFEGKWRLLVEMDGHVQPIEQGHWCSRGRVGSVKALERGRIWNVVLHLDNGRRQEFRAILVRPKVEPVEIPAPFPEEEEMKKKEPA